MQRAAPAFACRSHRTPSWSTAKGMCSIRMTTARPARGGCTESQTNAHTGRYRAPVLPCTTSRASMRARIFCRWRMTLYTLGPNENKDGPFAEVHARNEFEARRRVQSVDTRRNGSISTPFTAYQLGRQIRAISLLERSRIFEKFEDLPPA